MAERLLHQSSMNTWCNLPRNCFLWPPFALTLKHSYNLWRLVFKVTCYLAKAQSKKKKNVTRVVVWKFSSWMVIQERLLMLLAFEKFVTKYLLELCLLQMSCWLDWSHCLYLLNPREGSKLKSQKFKNRERFSKKLVLCVLASCCLDCRQSRMTVWFMNTYYMWSTVENIKCVRSYFGFGYVGHDSWVCRILVSTQRSSTSKVCLCEGHPPVSWPSSWQLLLHESSPPFIIIWPRSRVMVCRLRSQVTNA